MGFIPDEMRANYSEASAVPSVNHQPSRPLSPVTTLLNSLAQAKTCLAETKSNLKSIRKTHKAALSELRKEIEKHRGLIGNDRGEERAFRRNLALRESIKRAEEETEVMEKQLADLQQPPEKLKPEWEIKKKQWQAEKHRLAAAQTKAAEEKANADRKAAAVESELAILSSKKEKLMARLTKLNVDLGKLDSANSEGSDTKEKKQAEREASEERRERLEKEYLDAIHRLETRIEEYGAQSRSNWAAYYALESTTPQQTVTDVPIPSSAQGCGSLISNRERSSSLFSDGSVITNLSELGNPGVLPAFGPIPNRHASAEYTLGPMAVVGRGEGGE